MEPPQTRPAAATVKNPGPTDMGLFGQFAGPDHPAKRAIARVIGSALPIWTNITRAALAIHYHASPPALGRTRHIGHAAKIDVKDSQ